jgi:hypothetical protein
MNNFPIEWPHKTFYFSPHMKHFNVTIKADVAIALCSDNISENINEKMSECGYRIIH